MRTKLKYIFFMLFCGCFYACEDALEVVPENSVTFENMIQDESGLESSVNAIRSYFARGPVYTGSNIIYRRGLIFDKDNTNGEFSGVLDMYPSAYSPFMSTTSWANYYQIVALTHVVLDNAKYVKGIKNERMDFYMGQAYFYRAYMYLIIAQTWGDAVILTTSRDNGEKAKSPWNEVVEQALSDVNKAIQLLPGRDSLYNYAGQKLDRNDVPCREVACTLKAFACAWHASLNKEYFGKDESKFFEEAVEAATRVIESSHNYKLASTVEEVCNSVLMGGSREGIFEMETKDYATQVGFTSSSYYATWPVRRDMGPSDILSNSRLKLSLKIRYTTASSLFEEKGDARRASYFYKLDSMGQQVSTAITGGFAYPCKFRKELVDIEGYTKGTFVNYDQPRIIYRLADLILLRAECYARLGKDDLAIADLNEIRKRANTTNYPAPTDTKGLRYAIFKEREKELLWEDTRYFDMVRNNYFREDAKSETVKKLTDAEIRDGAIYLPVENGEFSANRLMVQNTYWMRIFN